METNESGNVNRGELPADAGTSYVVHGSSVSIMTFNVLLTLCRYFLPSACLLCTYQCQAPPTTPQANVGHWASISTGLVSPGVSLLLDDH